MRSLVSLLGLVVNAQVLLAKEAAGAWGDSDPAQPEAYYEDEDFFAPKSGHGSDPVPAEMPGKTSPKTFFIEKSVSLKAAGDVANEWDEAQYVTADHVTDVQTTPDAKFSPFAKLTRKTSLKNNILGPATMRFKEARASADNTYVSPSMMLDPRLPLSGLLSETNNPTSNVDSSRWALPDCAAFSNTPEGIALYQRYYQDNVAFYSQNPCPNLPAPPGVQNPLPTVGGQNTIGLLKAFAPAPEEPHAIGADEDQNSYYHVPVGRMIPSLQLPNFDSPPVNFRSDGRRYPQNMERYDAFPPAAGGAAGASGGKA